MLADFKRLFTRGGGPLLPSMFRGMDACDVEPAVQGYVQKASEDLQAVLGAEYATSDPLKKRVYTQAEEALALHKAYLVLASLNAGLAKTESAGGASRTYGEQSADQLRRLATEWWQKAVKWVPGLEAVAPEATSSSPTPVLIPVGGAGQAERALEYPWRLDNAYDEA